MTAHEPEAVGRAAGGVVSQRPWPVPDRRLPVPARRVGRPRGPHGTGPVGHPLIRVEAQPDRGDAGGRTAVYARASSADQTADQDRQVARATAGAAEHGCAVGGVVTEIGAAPKGRRRRGPHEACLVGPRRRFLARLRDPSVTTIVVEPRDRFARFGAESVEAAPAAQGRRLPVPRRGVPIGASSDGVPRDRFRWETPPGQLREGCRMSAGDRSAATARIAVHGD